MFSPFGEAIWGTDHGPVGFMAEFGMIEEATGLLFSRARFTSRNIGAFISDDPSELSGGDINYRRWVKNNPVSFIDPTGFGYFEYGGPSGVHERYRFDDGTTIGLSPGVTNNQSWNNLWAGPGMLQEDSNGNYNRISAEFDDTIMRRVVADYKKQYGETPHYNLLTSNCRTFAAALRARYVVEWWRDLLSQVLTLGGEEVGRFGGDGVAPTAQSMDPNEKFGAAGYGPQHWIRGDATIPYRINFENLGPGSKDPVTGQGYATYATAPAQRVTIADQLSDKLDWSTFYIAEFGFGDTVIAVPAGRTYYLLTTTVTYDGRTFDVAIEAGMDFETGRVWASFQSLDAETGLPPDVLTGFLPPEDGTGRGMGHFLFKVKPKADLPHGTELRNVALISFDGQTIIATNQVDPQDPGKGTDPQREALNTIDAMPPTVVPGTPPIFRFDGQPQTLAICFTEDVSQTLDAGDFVVTNLTTGEVVPTDQLAVSYDAVTNIATLSFPGSTNGGVRGILPDGQYSVRILKDGVADPVGNLFSADYTTTFRTLLADLDGDGNVNFNDLLSLAQNYGQTPRTYRQGDINHDGTVDFADLLLLAQRYGTSVTVTAEVSVPAAGDSSSALAGADFVGSTSTFADESIRRRGVEGRILASTPATSRKIKRSVAVEVFG